MSPRVPVLAAFLAALTVQGASALSPRPEAARSGEARAAAVSAEGLLNPGAANALSELASAGAQVSGVRAGPDGMVRVLRGRLADGHALEGDSPEARARAFVAGARGFLGIEADVGSLALQEVRETVLGTTVRFERRVEGLPLDPGTVVVQLDPRGTVTWVAHEGSTDPLPAGRLARIRDEDAIAAALSDLAPRGALRAAPTTRAVVSTRAGKAEAVTEVLVPSSDPLGDWLYRIAADGRIVSREDRLWYARGRVFAPNAVVATQNPGLKDLNDAAAAVPASAYTEVELLGLDGSGTLTGAYCSTADTANRANEPSGNFLYDRADLRFEEVMTYHHIDFAQRMFQSVGITNANNRQQVLGAHGTTQDNSWYSPATKKLTFGDGGVDDAEDAEIIWHEYGHSTQDNQVPGWGSGGHARAMGEAFGDYLGGALSQRKKSFQLECVGDWDGVSYSNANPPCLRRLDSTKHFPEDLKGQEHADGEIWSACLWQIHQGMGAPDDSLKLVLAHHFLLAPGATMPQAAEAMLQADQQLFGGSHRDLIRSVFMARGILESSSFLEVTLRDAAGAPVGGKVELVGTGVSFVVPGSTGVALRKVAPGSYTLAVSAFGFVAPENRTVTVGDDETKKETFSLQAAPSAQLTGRVRSSAGSGVAARLRLMGTGMAPVQAQADGSFTLSAPAGSYELAVSAVGFAGKKLPGVAIPGSGLEIVVDPVSRFLVVDDDGSKPYETFFQAALTDLGHSFQAATLTGEGGLGVDDLTPFEAVIWLCGDRYSGIFPEATQAAVREYLAEGGRLLVSGQDIGYGLKSTPFYTEVLGAGFVKDTAGSKEVEGAGLSFSLEGGDGAGNQKYPDVLNAAQGASLWLKYRGGEGAAVVNLVGPGRVVYLGFGLEGVATAEGRKLLMGAMLEAAGTAEAQRRTLSARWSER